MKVEKIVNGIVYDDQMLQIIKDLDLLHKITDSRPYVMKENSGKIFIKCEAGFYSVDQYMDALLKKYSKNLQNKKQSVENVDFLEICERVREGFKIYQSNTKQRKLDTKGSSLF